MLSYLCIDRYGKPFGGYPTFEEKVAADIAEAKQYYPLVIVSFHWGLEPTSSQPNRGYKPTDNQIRLGRLLATIPIGSSRLSIITACISAIHWGISALPDIKARRI